MAEFASLELVDWDLQAIVRGSTGDYYNFCSTTSTDQPNSCYDLMEMPKENDLDDFLFCFPELLDTAAMLTDELQELCKPFYTVSDSSPAQNSPPGPTTPSISVCKKEPADVVHHHDHQDQPARAAATAYTPKYKRRKNQQKRVVLQVTAEDLSSDKWAWRKYGQKPIKGSPYPRSYYRCSSSKGCLARKQVEESCTDPGIFIITYTAEHSHSQPTRKNALAGTIRQKFSTPKCNSNTTPKNRGPRKCSPSPSLVSSPKTPQLLAEEEFLARNIERRENKDENDREMVDVSRNNGILVPEVMFDDDFFSGLGDLDGLISELGDGHCSTEAVSSESDLL